MAALDAPGLLALRLLCVGIAYYLTARLGLLIPYVGTHISLMWLPTGIAVAAYMRWGGLMSASIFAAAFAANVAIGGPLWMGLGIAIGNALGPWLSALVLRRLGFDCALTRRVDLGLYLVAVLAGMVVTASNGTTWLRLAGLLPMSQWGPAWTSWWVGDAVGALLGGVPLLAITRATARETFGGRRGAFNVALLTVVLVCSLLTFSTWIAPALLFPLLSLPLFVTAVLALRAGVLAASLSVLLLSAAAAWGTAQGVGPFAGHDGHTGLLALWSYITAQACTSVLICGLTAELLSSRRQQAALFQHANEGILLVGPDGRIGALNPAAGAMLKVKPSEVLGRHLVELPQGNGAALVQVIADAALPGATQQDLRLTRNDGAQLHVEAQTARHCDARGHWQTQVMLRDVTERKAAEAGLAANEQRLRLIANNMPALITYIDHAHRLVFANETYADWFGIRPESMIGKHFSECFGEASYMARKPFLDEALRTGQRLSHERESERGGRQRHLRSTYVPDLASDGSVVGLYELTMDISESKAVETQLLQLARVDHLTGLPNRLQFEDKLREALARSERTKLALALLYIDIDHFKTINDTQGHATGDTVLKEFADRLKGAVRISDTVARLGGDEFVMVLEQLHNNDEAELIASKIVAAMQAPIVLASGTVTATASIGVGLLRDDDEASSPGELMAAADAALYDAKYAGRNTFRVRACT
ncbi:diguanylate cyclase domain-containing protein [Variovorax sp. RT4R15]|uniref:diguanylate cyclase domain-containing protein n=1 Tax=Variovorax sp. RT4R15 TaxID=3443737 RepID=UPI003F483DF5